MKKKKKSPYMILKDATWKLCSEYIRRRDADEYDMVNCVTCGVRKHWKKMQAGHFVDGRNNTVLFDDRGIFPQCYSCNVCKHGNKLNYYKYMELNYSQKLIDELMRGGNETRQLTMDDLQVIKQYYKDKIKGLNNE